MKMGMTNEIEKHELDYYYLGYLIFPKDNVSTLK